MVLSIVLILLNRKRKACVIVEKHLIGIHTNATKNPETMNKKQTRQGKRKTYIWSHK